MHTKEKRIIFLIFAAVFLFTLVGGYVFSIPDGKLHVVFCNVGQGDGIYMRLPDGKDVVIDGGPNNKILTCLGQHMAFWDREIDLVLLTHPHEDHFKGLTEVLRRYSIENIVVPPIVNNESDYYKKFVSQVEKENAAVKNLYQGEQIDFTVSNGHSGNPVKVMFNLLWPTESWVADNSNEVLKQNVLGVKTAYNDLNDFSQVFLLTYGNFDILFTGDAGKEIIEPLIEGNLIPQNTIEILKVPHHGSNTALSEKILSFIKPRLGIIMVGKNSYGHPSPEMIDLLENDHVSVKRTDQDGEVEIISDGNSWRLTNSKKVSKGI